MDAQAIDSHDVAPADLRRIAAGVLTVRDVRAPRSHESNAPGTTGGGQDIPAFLLGGAALTAARRAGAPQEPVRLVSIGERVAVVIFAGDEHATTVPWSLVLADV